MCGKIWGFAVFVWIALAAISWASTENGRQAYLEGDYARAIELLTPEAEAGDPVAQNVLGNAYDDGNGVEQNTAKAIEWLEKAAAQDFAKAIYNLAIFHQDGRPDLPVDLEKAGAYYDRAIELGYHYAMNNRALMLELGQGGARNTFRAIGLFKKAVELGNTDAMRNLGDRYRTGEGVPEDTAKAMALYRQGATLGHPSSLNALGAMYEGGISVEQDLVAALGLYRLAMEQGYPTSAVNIAFLMTEVDAYWRDPLAGLAHCFWAEGKASAEEAAGIALDCGALADNLTADEVERARALAGTF